MHVSSQQSTKNCATHEEVGNRWRLSVTGILYVVRKPSGSRKQTFKVNGGLLVVNEAFDFALCHRECTGEGGKQFGGTCVVWQVPYPLHEWLEPLIRPV